MNQNIKNIITAATEAANPEHKEANDIIIAAMMAERVPTAKALVKSLKLSAANRQNTGYSLAVTNPKNGREVYLYYPGNLDPENIGREFFDGCKVYLGNTEVSSGQYRYRREWVRADGGYVWKKTPNENEGDTIKDNNAIDLYAYLTAPAKPKPVKLGLTYIPSQFDLLSSKKTRSNFTSDEEYNNYVSARQLQQRQFERYNDKEVSKKLNPNLTEMKELKTERNRARKYADAAMTNLQIRKSDMIRQYNDSIKAVIGPQLEEAAYNAVSAQYVDNVRRKKAGQPQVIRPAGLAINQENYFEIGYPSFTYKSDDSTSIMTVVDYSTIIGMPYFGIQRQLLSMDASVQETRIYTRESENFVGTVAEISAKLSKMMRSEDQDIYDAVRAVPAIARFMASRRGKV